MESFSSCFSRLSSSFMCRYNLYYYESTQTHHSTNIEDAPSCSPFSIVLLRKVDVSYPRLFPSRNDDNNLCTHKRFFFLTCCWYIVTLFAFVHSIPFVPHCTNAKVLGFYTNAQNVVWVGLKMLILWSCNGSFFMKKLTTGLVQFYLIEVVFQIEKVQ